MSRAGFWLRGAKGKLAGSVLQKGENGTIIRERVDPRNPQTMEQMKHRVAFGTCASAAKWMLPVIGIAFEGINDPKMGRRAFISINTNMLKNHASISLITSRAHEAFQGKGNSQLVPNPYIVSKGSLPQPSQIAFSMEGNVDGQFVIPDITAELTIGSTYTAAELWETILGLKAGQQLTRVCIFTLNGENVISFGKITEEWGDYMRYSRFFSDRIVLNSGDGDSITINSGTTYAQINTCLMSLVATEQTADTFFPEGIVSDVVADGDTLTVTVAKTSITPEYNDTKYKLQAFGCFISELVNNRWCYSTCQLVANEPLERSDADTYYGLFIGNAIESYLKGSSALMSDRYTQQGGEDDLVGDFQ